MSIQWLQYFEAKNVETLDQKFWIHPEFLICKFILDQWLCSKAKYSQATKAALCISLGTDFLRYYFPTSVFLMLSIDKE